MHDQSALSTWSAVVVLGIAAFIMVTTEFAPIGLLSGMALDLGRDRATIALTVTLYAWVGAASGLLSVVYLKGFPRKPLLIILMLILAVSNGVAMISDSFAALLFARTLGAVAHGFFWATVAAFATELAPPGRIGLATSIVFGGISLASVAGVPLANLIGSSIGWRAAFGIAGVLGLLTALLMMVLIPHVTARLPASQVVLGDVLRRADLRAVYAVTAFTAMAHFAAYTFIEPFLGAVPGLPHLMISVLLFGLGAAGLLGNVLSGFLLDKYLHQVIALALLALCLALTGLGWFGLQFGSTVILAMLLVWGAAIAALFASLQTWILRQAGTAAMAAAAAVHTTVLNAAIGIGATLGAWILDVSSLSGVMLAAGVFAMLPLAMLTQSQLRKRFHLTEN